MQSAEAVIRLRDAAAVVGASSEETSSSCLHGVEPSRHGVFVDNIVPSQELLVLSSITSQHPSKLPLVLTSETFFACGSSWVVDAKRYWHEAD